MNVKDKTGRAGYKNFAITVPADLAPEIARRAAQADLTVSAYLRRLVRLDVNELKKT